MTAEKAAIVKAHESAKEHGLVEKTAGESGAAGILRNKWVKWLASEHGNEVATRLGAEGGAPTVEETKLFSTWVYTMRQKYSAVGSKGGGDSYGLLQIPYMLAPAHAEKPSLRRAASPSRRQPPPAARPSTPCH